ncbi:MAG: hypothetical protein A2113_00875 [Candidatus Woykebacteria bacterium GWA1_44_8]|uniref:tRNA-2-methylthio-N(6)-dimethylallyladenosine synthase n=1 Tax=Candidatus Woykebacteria bacterium GWA1_44_8 TaxID=1802591 RepID=A0A1G1W2G1_9BACT|nr:MAG: hypothetical protein A2113_00875 [Candidatus Woykebacteria bacterium GWA1_44_8]
MRQLKYHIITFGCQQNKADSERIASAFEARGFKKSPSLERADQVVINTCMVRQHAEDRIYGLMEKLAHLKTQNPNFKLILTGCLVGVMVRDSTGKFYRLIKQRLPLVNEFLPIDEVGFDIPAKRESKTHAWVIISNGCNNFCSYCIVPFTRGREVSRPWHDIMAEVTDLVNKGYKQVTLLGQNVNSYGADFVKEHLKGGKYILLDGRTVLPVMVRMSMGRKRIPTLFPYLLEEVAKRGFKKISFLSANPWDFSAELIEVIARNPNIDRYIHLPIQSGNDQVLRRMNRWYKAADYKKLVKKIREKIPGVEIGTDIVVGFPGETESGFQNTVKLAKEIGWSVAYIAMYSPRPHTASAKNFPDDISSSEKHRRFHILNELINKQKVAVPNNHSI